MPGHLPRLFLISRELWWCFFQCKCQKTAVGLLRLVGNAHTDSVTVEIEHLWHFANMFKSQETGLHTSETNAKKFRMLQKLQVI